MNFKNRLKGSVTQSLVRSLLADGGISVVPLGIEEVIREVTELPIERYLALNLPDGLRKLPDFFATNSDRTESWLIEVKFRKEWNRNTRFELGATLLPQVQIWSPLYLFLFFGESPAKVNPENPGAWVRVGKLTLQENRLFVRVGKESKPWAEAEWHSLDRIQDVFPEINQKVKWEEGVIQDMLTISKHLSSLK